MSNKISYLLLITITLFSCGPKKQEVSKPNVLFILVDDYGYTDCSVMGSKYYETPNIDRIAREGMLFTDGYATCQVCSPSRASILSGKFPARHGITDWIGAKTAKIGAIQAGPQNSFLRTMPTIFSTVIPHCRKL
ncbi:sulfatase-like hydrolase/transferase [Draconibacterium orientale]|uniref:sulfatase-like hydrolase/transferase n=1 Tax=Draconibacterium orientale TaxID=1168034 RepID=UPI0029BFCE0F|nr:sulfatase-like hydrolase/transferase [Draconibacterium orientale]